MPKVTNQTTGQVVDCEEGDKLQEVIQNNDMGVPFGCESGICCTCLIQINSGEENLNPVKDIEAMTLDARGSLPDERLACQCIVNGDIEFEQP